MKPKISEDEFSQCASVLNAQRKMKKGQRRTVLERPRTTKQKEDRRKKNAGSAGVPADTLSER